MKREIVLTESDRERLMKYISDARYSDIGMSKSFKDLENEISKAKMVGSKQVGKDVVTMNSHVVISINGRKREVHLVYPNESDMSTNRMSVLSPIGMAILGYRVGDVIEWEIPSGKANLKIEQILYQPEAAGDYHL